jgi:hypothetical protein
MLTPLHRVVSVRPLVQCQHRGAATNIPWRKAMVESAGTTKSALFHHFDGKQALGYAVMD